VGIGVYMAQSGSGFEKLRAHEVDATSADPRCSIQSVSSMIAASSAHWFWLILKS